MFDVIGIGSVFVDYFFNVDEIILKKNNLKPEDDFLFKEKNIDLKDIFEKPLILDKSPGGISLNTIAVLGALNRKVSFCGLIGKDKNARYFLNNLKKVDKSHLIKIGKMSRCFCFLSHNRKRRTFLSEVNPNDNDFFKKIDLNFLNTARFIHVGPFLSDSKEILKNIEGIFNKIKRPLISFSPGIRYINFGLKTLLPLFKKTYVLFLNEQETKRLTKKNVEEGSKYLLNYGIKIIVCTMGKNGAMATTKKEQIFEKGIKIKKVVDPTGAGDSFAAGFLYGLLNNKSLKESLILANKIASKSVSDFGLRWLKDIKELKLT
ncbi:MAG: carbohydrate kinase family protein [Candidatus Levyibacteriota bacterium]